jgi:hypothetical protein
MQLERNDMTQTQEIRLALADEFVAQGIWTLEDVDAFMLSEVQ